MKRYLISLIASANLLTVPVPAQVFQDNFDPSLTTWVETDVNFGFDDGRQIGGALFDSRDYNFTIVSETQPSRIAESGWAQTPEGNGPYRPRLATRRTGAGNPPLGRDAPLPPVSGGHADGCRLQSAPTFSLV
jgi:hypothetical protein